MIKGKGKMVAYDYTKISALLERCCTHFSINLMVEFKPNQWDQSTVLHHRRRLGVSLQASITLSDCNSNYKRDTPYKLFLRKSDEESFISALVNSAWMTLKDSSYGELMTIFWTHYIL